jgi:hypothetical protein
MHAVEFEADIKGNIIEIPAHLPVLRATHARVILLTEDSLPQPRRDFADFIGKLQWTGDALAEQRRLRDEW